MALIGNERPTASLDYLSERARVAHLDGDGVLVNHLAAIALERVSKTSKAEVPLCSWAWAVVFALYWLTEEYMLREVQKILELERGCRDSEQELLGMLRVYSWLVGQPLDSDCRPQREILLSAELAWCTDEDGPEVETLLLHLVELLWFRMPDNATWAEIPRKWNIRIKPDLREKLVAIETRLRIQASIVVLGTTDAANSTVDEKWDTQPWVPELWRAIFDSKFAEIDRILAVESPRTSANSPTGRLLFDARNYNRWFGAPGDSISVGLTRRQWATSNSAELVFHDLREKRVSGILAELNSDQGGASDRFFGFSLAMLLETASLRRWDFAAWCEASEFQARLYAEVATREPNRVDFVNRSIRCAVQCFRLRVEHKWAALMLSRLELLSRPDLSRLLKDLLQAHPAQYHCVQLVVGALGDAIPTDVFDVLTDWVLRYVDYSTHVNRFGGTRDKIGFLAPFLAELPELHISWTKLWPIIKPLFGDTVLWNGGSSHLLRTVLQVAPVALAREAVSVMLSVESGPVNDRGRWQLLCEIADLRSAIVETHGPEIIAATPFPEDLVSLLEVKWAKPFLNPDVDAARERAKLHLEAVLKKAVRTKGQTNFEMGIGVWEIMFVVPWKDADLMWAERLVSAIDNPDVITGYLPPLLAYVTAMVENGPETIVTMVNHRLASWLKNAPTGVNPMQRFNGVFSSFLHYGTEKKDTTSALIHLAAAVRKKIPRIADESIVAYVFKSAAQPPAGSTGAMMTLTLDLAIDQPARRPELFLVAQTLLLVAWIRSNSGAHSATDLTDGFRAPAHLTWQNGDSMVETEVIREMAERLTPVTVSVAQTSGPRVRGQIAAFLNGLKKRGALTRELAELQAQLMEDPRASVRRLAAESFD